MSRVPDLDPGQEASLVQRLRAGEDDAYRALLELYGGSLLRAARRLLRDEDEAADALQEAFLSAFRSIDKFQENSRLSTWLYKIVVNHSLMRLRSRRAKGVESLDDLLPQFDETGHHLVPPSPWRTESDSPRDAAQRSEEEAIVRAAIDRLPDPYRTVVVLRDLEGLETAEVADLLQINANTAKVRLHRARQALRTLLDPVFGVEVVT